MSTYNNDKKILVEVNKSGKIINVFDTEDVLSDFRHDLIDCLTALSMAEYEYYQSNDHVTKLRDLICDNINSEKILDKFEIKITTKPITKSKKKQNDD